MIIEFDSITLKNIFHKKEYQTYQMNSFKIDPNFTTINGKKYPFTHLEGVKVRLELQEINKKVNENMRKVVRYY